MLSLLRTTCLTAVALAGALSLFRAVMVMVNIYHPTLSIPYFNPVADPGPDELTFRPRFSLNTTFGAALYLDSLANRTLNLDADDPRVLWARSDLTLGSLPDVVLRTELDWADLSLNDWSRPAGEAPTLANSHDLLKRIHFGIFPAQDLAAGVLDFRRPYVHDMRELVLMRSFTIHRLNATMGREDTVMNPLYFWLRDIQVEVLVDSGVYTSATLPGDLRPYLSSLEDDPTAYLPVVTPPAAYPSAAHLVRLPHCTQFNAAYSSKLVPERDSTAPCRVPLTIHLRPVSVGTFRVQQFLRGLLRNLIEDEYRSAVSTGAMKSAVPLDIFELHPFRFVIVALLYMATMVLALLEVRAEAVHWSQLRSLAGLSASWALLTYGLERNPLLHYYWHPTNSFYGIPTLIQTVGFVWSLYCQWRLYKPPVADPIAEADSPDGVSAADAATVETKRPPAQNRLDFSVGLFSVALLIVGSALVDDQAPLKPFRVGPDLARLGPWLLTVAEEVGLVTALPQIAMVWYCRSTAAYPARAQIYHISAGFIRLFIEYLSAVEVSTAGRIKRGWVALCLLTIVVQHGWYRFTSTVRLKEKTA
ncbi:hypothetical protein IWQ60_000119 [Tieghemiomyces parasiticus]|uniref:Uncharacterized protein n=1 Tax=Tieghemiomyces parasiticus TaxID=78921 RepID=A0A9W8AMR3_9FUNG|nr:hypothetical protein IWQ60_000119 [Tieghemiomyces parasiticus]